MVLRTSLSKPALSTEGSGMLANPGSAPYTQAATNSAGIAIRSRKQKVNCFDGVLLFVTPWTITHQAHLSRQVY